MRKDIVDKISKKEPIELSIETFEKAYDIIQILKGHDYYLYSCCSYSGIKPNCLFKHKSK